MQPGTGHPQSEPRPQLVLGHVGTTCMCKDSAEGPSPPQEWGLDPTQSQDLPSAPPPILLLCTSPRPAPPGFPPQPRLRPQGPASAQSTCVLYLPLRPVPSDPATHPSSLWPMQVRRQRLEGELTSKIRTAVSGLGAGCSRLCPCRLSAQSSKSPAHTESGPWTSLKPQSPRKTAQLTPW